MRFFLMTLSRNKSSFIEHCTKYASYSDITKVVMTDTRPYDVIENYNQPISNAVMDTKNERSEDQRVLVFR